MREGKAEGVMKDCRGQLRREAHSVTVMSKELKNEQNMVARVQKHYKHCSMFDECMSALLHLLIEPIT